MGAIALACLGALFLLYALVLTLQSAFATWGYAKASGQVQRVVSTQGQGRSAPVVTFTDASGRSHTVLMPQAPQSVHYAAGDTVDVLYDAREPSEARLTGFTQAFAFPLLLAAAGSLLLLVAATMTEPPEALRALGRSRARPPMDASRLQYHPFNAVAVKHYLAETGLPGTARKVKITDAAQALSLDRVPVGLAEYLAYASALAYLPGAAAYLAQHCPRVTKPAQFEWQGARALVFLFEGHAFVAMAETDSAGTAAQVRALFSRRAGAGRYLPEDTVWDAAPRNAAAAKAWDGLRASVEAWCKEAAPDRGGFDDETAKTPFILTGHGLGGTMAVIAAYEFAKRGRSVAAVVTFGAVSAGGKDFAEEYRELGLESRTLAVAAQQAALPPKRWPLSAPPIGLRWDLPPAPDASPVRSVPPGSTFLQRRAHKLLAREEASGPTARRGLAPAVLARLLAASASTRTAMLRHDIERRYALPLTQLMYARLKEVLGGERGQRELDQAISDHLLDIRGVRPQHAHEAFLTLDDLPAPSDAQGQPQSVPGPAAQGT